MGFSSGLRLVINLILSTAAISGCLFLAMALDQPWVPKDLQNDVPAQFRVWEAMLPAGVITLKQFCVLLGLCKISGVMALWGLFGASLEKVANLLFIVLMGCAIYTHVALEDGKVAPPTVMGVLYIVRFLLLNETTKTKTN